MPTAPPARHPQARKHLSKQRGLKLTQRHITETVGDLNRPTAPPVPQVRKHLSKQRDLKQTKLFSIYIMDAMVRARVCVALCVTGVC